MPSIRPRPVVLLTFVVAVLAATLGPGTSAIVAAPAAAPVTPTWHRYHIGTEQQLRGLDAVDRRHVWVAGEDGGVFTTSNGGRTWRDVSPPAASDLALRDVEAISRRHALVMAIGPGDESRIFSTSNGGRSWHTAFVNHDDAAFYDCMAMWPGGRRGLAMSDPVDNRFRIIVTEDGGRTWQRRPRGRMPLAVTDEYGFAASGTCVAATARREAYFVTGGAAARIFHSTDGGTTWTVRDSTLPATPAGGVFSIAFNGPRHGIAVGGDFEQPDGSAGSATSTDRGLSWTAGGELPGYRSGVAWRWDDAAVAVGPSGSDITRNGGATWTRFSGLNLDSVVCIDRVCWGSGAGGVVAKLVPRR